MTDTPDGAAAVLVRHLAEVCQRGAVDWMITGPGDRIRYGHFEPRPGQSASAAAADHVDVIHGELIRDAARLMTVPASNR